MKAFCFFNHSPVSQPFRVFHVLDSFAPSTLPDHEVDQLQHIILKYFGQESFKEGRISVNVAQVTHDASLVSVNSSNDSGTHSI